MHNKFKRFGFFGFRNQKEELNNGDSVDDKIIKYLYKKDSKTKDHKKKSRNKSTHHEDKQHKKHRKESSDNRTSPPTEDVKKHKKSRNKEKSIPDHKTKHKNVTVVFDENEKSHNKQKYEELVKLVKDHKHLKETLINSNAGDYKCLTKKEIFKLLSHVKYLPKDAAITPALMKKFFTFDKKEFVQNTGRADDNKHSKKASRHKHDNTVVAHCVDQKPEKASKRSEKKSKETTESVEARKSPIKDRKHHDQNKAKVTETLTPQKKKHKNKLSVKNEEEMQAPQSAVYKSKSSVHDIENFKNVQQEIVRLVQAVRKAREKELRMKKECDNVSVNNVKAEITAKPKSRKEDSERNVEEQKINRVNPLRHKFCLVKNTFSIVEIPSTVSTPIDRKKKTNVFKRYYKYDNCDTETEIRSETYQTNSDSNKLYEEASKLSNNVQKHHTDKVKKAKVDSEQILNSETHVSLVILPEDTKSNQNKDGGNYKKEISSRSSVKGSKIPVLSSPVRVGQTIKKTLIGSKVKNVGQTACDKISETVQKTKQRTDKIQSFETVKENPSNVKSASVKFAKKKDSSSVKSSKTVTEEAVRPKRTNDQKGVEKIPIEKHLKSPLFKNRAKNSETKKKLGNKRLEEEESNVSDTFKIIKQSDRTNNQRRKLSAAPSRISTDSSSLLSRGSKKLNKSFLASNSDTKVHQSKKSGAEKTVKKFERSSTRASFSNSTFGDKSDSTTKTTSFFLTKSYRDDDKLSRWRKSKMYADTVRRNLINKKAPVIPAQVMEVRYLTVTNEALPPPKTDLEITLPPSPLPEEKETDDLALVLKEQAVEEINMIEKETTIVEFFMDDLPQPCVEAVNPENFNELFQLPTDEALNEILNENYNFLQKDFSYKIDSNNSSCSSSDLLSCTDVVLRQEKKSDDCCWFDDESLSDVSCSHKFSDVDGGNFGKLVDSEESGYSTLESGPVSSNFFTRPDIKALFYPPCTETPLDSYFFEMQVETSNKSSSSLEIRSIESKSLQTVIECCQKSVQIKLSQEKIPEMPPAGDDKEPTAGVEKPKERRVKRGSFFLSCITCLEGEK